MATRREIENERMALLETINAKLDLALNILEAMDEREGSESVKKTDSSKQKGGGKN